MKIVGIVAEFNPFHNGHKYLIDYAKNELKADYVIIAMSGDYVQRGEPAIFDKYIRAKVSVINGADAVFALPVHISISSASYYALGAVSLLNKLGCDSLLFGSEYGDIEKIAASSYELNVIESPNNILAREYLNAIRSLHLSIEPATIKRVISDYNNNDSIKDGFCSAGYLRKNYNEIFASYASFNPESGLPENAYNEIKEYLRNQSPVFYNDFSEIFLSKLIEGQNAGYSDYFDIFDDLSSKISKNVSNFTTLSEFTDLLKSKDIARSHLQRGFMNICLGISKESFRLLKSYEYAPYGRLIAFNKNTDVMNIISKRARIPITSKLADFYKDIAPDIKSILDSDINASHLYSYFSNNKKIINELKRKIVLI